MHFTTVIFFLKINNEIDLSPVPKNSRHIILILNSLLKLNTLLKLNIAPILLYLYSINTVNVNCISCCFQPESGKMHDKVPHICNLLIRFVHIPIMCIS
uniref:Uncharacterized protein n=1 Tax=Anguilla anguilla TaxID=7936 RepID=A0A0E9TFE8_ANGAN